MQAKKITFKTEHAEKLYRKKRKTEEQIKMNLSLNGGKTKHLRRRLTKARVRLRYGQQQKFS